MQITRTFVAAFAAALAACATPCPNGGRTLAISYVGPTRGTTVSNAMTLASDHGIDRLAVQSEVGDPGIKYTTAEVMCALYEHFIDLGFEDRMKPGRLVVGPGFEMRDGSEYWNYTQPANATLEDFERFKTMLGDFLELYNQTFSLQTVPEKVGRDAFESTQRTTNGGA
jgi:hypothetical protein